MRHSMDRVPSAQCTAHGEAQISAVFNTYLSLLLLIVVPTMVTIPLAHLP